MVPDQQARVANSSERDEVVRRAMLTLEQADREGLEWGDVMMARAQLLSWEQSPSEITFPSLPPSKPIDIDWPDTDDYSIPRVSHSPLFQAYEQVVAEEEEIVRIRRTMPRPRLRIGGMGQGGILTERREALSKRRGRSR
jgi:hypothetical protein